MRVGREFHVHVARAQARDEGRDQGTPDQLQLHLATGLMWGFLRVETRLLKHTNSNDVTVNLMVYIYIYIFKCQYIYICVCVYI